MMRTGGGEGERGQTEGIEGYGRAFLSSITGWGDRVFATLGALVGAFVAVMFVGIPTALISLTTLSIVLPAALCALGAWMIWRELIRE